MESLRDRRLVFIAIIGVIFLIFIFRLFFLQVLSPEFSATAQNNVVKKVVIQPSRGIMYDRNGEIYVTNEPIYDLTVTPEDVTIPDTSLLQHYLGLPKQEIRARLAKAEAYSMKQPSTFHNHIDHRLYAQLQEHLWQFKGFNTVVRATRSYQHQVGANFLGYINEVDSSDIKASGGYYEQGDLAGRSGLERNYEKILRGKKGVKMILKDVHGREVGRFADGKYDTLPDKGKDIRISIDADLQAYGEKLMQGKKGAIVAIEPKTGEILAFVSSPVYDPSLLTGMDFVRNFRALKRDTLLPLYNRAHQAMYPPGSIFKTMMALTALQEGTITPNTRYGCGGGFARNRGRPACHAHGGPYNVHNAVKVSCNSFFAATYVDMMHHNKYESVDEAFNTWRRYMRAFGLGHRLGVDIPNETPGMLPTTALYDKWYGDDRWKGMTIVSNAIGQGEIKMTPLQMANLAAILANGGWYITPHFFKGYFNTPEEADVNFEYHRLPIDTAHFALVRDAMEKVVEVSTGRGAYVPDLRICGKTGTSQNPHGRDHSVFISYAPQDDPKIAVAAVVENSGYGGTWSAPICGLMIEKYLTDTISWRRKWRENRIVNKRFFQRTPIRELLKDQEEENPQGQAELLTADAGEVEAEPADEAPESAPADPQSEREAETASVPETSASEPAEPEPDTSAEINEDSPADEPEEEAPGAVTREAAAEEASPQPEQPDTSGEG